MINETDFLSRFVNHVKRINSKTTYEDNNQSYDLTQQIILISELLIFPIMYINNDNYIFRMILILILFKNLLIFLFAKNSKYMEIFFYFVYPGFQLLYFSYTLTVSNEELCFRILRSSYFLILVTYSSYILIHLNMKVIFFNMIATSLNLFFISSLRLNGYSLNVEQFLNITLGGIMYIIRKWLDENSSLQNESLKMEELNNFSILSKSDYQALNSENQSRLKSVNYYINYLLNLIDRIFRNVNSHILILSLESLLYANTNFYDMIGEKEEKPNNEKFISYIWENMYKKEISQNINKIFNDDKTQKLLRKFNNNENSDLLQALEYVINEYRSKNNNWEGKEIFLGIYELDKFKMFEVFICLCQIGNVQIIDLQFIGLSDRVNCSSISNFSSSNFNFNQTGNTNKNAFTTDLLTTKYSPKIKVSSTSCQNTTNNTTTFVVSNPTRFSINLERGRRNLVRDDIDTFDINLNFPKTTDNTLSHQIGKASLTSERAAICCNRNAKKLRLSVDTVNFIRAATDSNDCIDSLKLYKDYKNSLLGLCDIAPRSKSFKIKPLNKLEIQRLLKKSFSKKTCSNSLIVKKTNQKSCSSKSADINKSTGIKLAKVAHELKTPLMSIASLCNIIKANLKDKIQIENIDTINCIANYTNFLVIDFIDVSKSNEINITNKEIRLLDVLIFCYKILQSLVKTKDRLIDTKLRIAQDTSNVVIYTDELRLKQILLNFISNAVKFTKNGSISILLELSTFNDNLIVVIKDTGIGLSKNQLEKIKSLSFDQIPIDRSINSMSSGLGIGICFYLAKRMNIEIDINSSDLNGTEVSLNLSKIYRPLSKLDSDKNYSFLSIDQKNPEDVNSSSNNDSNLLISSETPRGDITFNVETLIKYNTKVKSTESSHLKLGDLRLENNIFISEFKRTKIIPNSSKNLFSEIIKKTSNIDLPNIILIVDDNKLIRKSIKNNLEQIIHAKELNFIIEEGYDGVDILKSIIDDQMQGNRIKCVFSDENMDYFNGSMASKMIVELERTKKIRCKPLMVCFTSYMDNTELDQYIRCGFDFVIEKNSKKHDLEHILKKI